MSPSFAPHLNSVVRSATSVASAFALAAALTPADSLAQGASTGFRHIVDIGCEGVNCFMALDGAPFSGPSGTTCAAPTLEFRWDASTPAGKLAYGSFLAAYSSGKVVSVYYSTCYELWNGVYPTIHYFHVTG